MSTASVWRSSVWTWIHSDHLGSATVIAARDGTAIRQLTYTAFGEEIVNSGSGDAPPYTYTGKERDSSGLLYYGARYYDPALARFITPDTVEDAGTQGLNRCSYALNNFLCIKRKYRQIQEEILDKIQYSPHCLERCQAHRACEEEEGVMEVRLNLGYHQILQLIRQLPPREQWRLTHDIEDELRLRDLSPEPNDDVAQFQALLLRGPIMSDEQFRQIQELRQGLSAWLERSFV